MPSNAAWLLSRALKPAVAEVDTGTEGDGEREVRAAVRAAAVEAVPGGGDSVEIRLTKARDAAERAHELEERALRAGQEARDLAERARQVSTEHGPERLTQVERETSRRVRERVAEAKKAADEIVERERRAAQADAEVQRREVLAEVDEEIQDARRAAEDAEAHAQELAESAAQMLAQARRLADEAAESARSAAEQANLQAKRLAEAAEQEASEAEALIDETEQMRTRSQAAEAQALEKLEQVPANESQDVPGESAGVSARDVVAGAVGAAAAAGVAAAAKATSDDFRSRLVPAGRPPRSEPVPAERGESNDSGTYEPEQTPQSAI